MEIENKKQRPVEFKDVYIGDVFYCSDKYFMRILSVGDFNAIDIESAQLTEFHSSTKVTPCEGYYHVK